MNLFGEVNVIYCSNTKNVIGTNNQLQYKIKEDLLYFKDITSTTNNLLNYVVMGYNTWLSIGSKPLPNRINIIITKNHKNEIKNLENVYVFSSIEDIMEYKSDKNIESLPKLFIIGGTQIYSYINK